MTIAIHITRALHLFSEAFNASFALELARQCPGNKFIFICDEEFDSLKNLPPNCSMVKLKAAPKSKMALDFLYRFKLPGILKKYKADFFIPAGNICCLNAKLPQLLILHDEEIQNPRFISYFKRRQAASEKKAKLIFAPGNIHSAVPGNKPILPLHPDPKMLETTTPPSFPKKDQQADPEANNYFLFVSSSINGEECITMLKAFSVFKKWQKSSLQLVIWPTHEKFAGIPSLDSYKYREDVEILPAAPAGFYKNRLAGSYAVISFSGYPGALAGLHSFESGTPFITRDEAGNRRLFEENCLYAGDSENDLGQKLILIYKNEDLRKELIQKGRDHITRFSVAQCAREITAAISAYN